MTGAAWVHADAFLDRPVQLERIRPPEIRFILAMLAADGVYDGPILAAWDQNSLRALRQLAKTRFDSDALTLRDLASLVQPFELSWRAGKWQVYRSTAADMSFQVPYEVVSRVTDGDSASFMDIKQELMIRTRIETPQDMNRIHQWVADHSLSPDTASVRQTSDLRITSAVLNDRTTSMYLFSERRGDRFATTQVQWQPQQAGAARVIVASLTTGNQAAIGLLKQGLLLRAVAALSSEGSDQIDADEPAEANVKKKPSGSFAGTGFYINNTDLMTAVVVLRSCQGLRLANGTALSPLEGARGIGALALTSPVRSRVWLPLSDRVPLPANSQLLSVGYGGDNPSGEVRTGTQGRLGSNDGPGRRLALAMPRFDGNLGAPVLDGRGQVVGIVVDPPSGVDVPHAEQTTLAAPAPLVLAKLDEAGVLYDTRGGSDAQDPMLALQGDKANAIVPLYCR